MTDRQSSNPIHAHYEQRFWQLQGLADSYSKNAINFLSLVNGGATVATLALIGAMDELKNNLIAYLVLAGYMIGTILVGFIYMHLVRKFNAMLLGWTGSYNREYLNGKKSYDQIIDEDTGRLNRLRWYPWLLGYCSFGLFVGTSIVAAGFLILSAVK